MNEILSKYWDHCGANFAHIKPNWEIKTGSRRERHFKKAFLEDIDFTDKTVVDYGCGGGWMGKYLFENRDIKKYIGVDVSERSLRASHEHLINYRDKTKLRKTPQNFKGFNADVFLRLACIQHFPTVDYLTEFLENINDSGIKYVVLHIRNGKTEYHNPYENNGDVVNAGRTNEKHVSGRLKNYRLTKELNKKISNSMYLIYEKSN